MTDNSDKTDNFCLHLSNLVHDRSVRNLGVIFDENIRLSPLLYC